MKCDREVTWLYFKQKVAYVRNDLTTYFRIIDIYWLCVSYDSNISKMNWKYNEKNSVDGIILHVTINLWSIQN